MEKRKMKKDIYLIHPVRDITKEERKTFDNYVQNLESNGQRVHYPIRDVNQDDAIGFKICAQHRDAISEVKEAHIYFNPASTGSMFDLGMIFYEDRALKIINPESLNGVKNCVTDFIKNYAGIDKKLSASFKIMTNSKKQLANLDEIEITWEKNPENLFYFGMAFMSHKPIRLSNREAVSPTPHKSYENVLLKLDELARG